MTQANLQKQASGAGLWTLQEGQVCTPILAKKRR